MSVVLHVAPHPDDELLGAPGTLLGLRDAGWRVVNLACSLGRPEQRARRLREVETACALAGFELRTTAEPIGISRADDLVAAEAALTAEIAAAISGSGASLVVGPSPHDAHHGHEVVGRATRAAIERTARRPRWWLWSLWGPAPLPTLYVPVAEEAMRGALVALEAHARELSRNDYARLLPARGQVAAVLGAEQVFGWGAAGRGDVYAELLVEVLCDRDRSWALAAARELRFADPLAPASSRGVDAAAWLSGPGPRCALE
jgi:LmbE family N-acetylglucosaminyl deacetylase